MLVIETKVTINGVLTYVLREHVSFFLKGLSTTLLNISEESKNSLQNHCLFFSHLYNDALVCVNRSWCLLEVDHGISYLVVETHQPLL